jgi:hypothetical protein
MEHARKTYYEGDLKCTVIGQFELRVLIGRRWRLKYSPLPKTITECYFSDTMNLDFHPYSNAYSNVRGGT